MQNSSSTIDMQISRSKIKDEEEGIWTRAATNAGLKSKYNIN